MRVSQQSLSRVKLRSRFRNMGRAEVAPTHLSACGYLQGQSWSLHQSLLCPGSGCPGRAAGRGCRVSSGTKQAAPGAAVAGWGGGLPPARLGPILRHGVSCLAQGEGE